MNGVIANITEETTSKLEATSDISIFFISVFLNQVSTYVRGEREFLS
jgi:hypothetical protein